MPDKFVVPQFIDNEDKILGPITVRQFLICLVATGVIFVWYTIFPTVYFVLLTILTTSVAGTFAFVKLNGQPFHLFFVNFLQTKTRPELRVWHKELSDIELKALMTTAENPVKERPTIKPRPASSRLRDLALTVNTGGVYNDEDT